MISNSASTSAAPITPPTPVPNVSSIAHVGVCSERVTTARHPVRPGYAAVQS